MKHALVKCLSLSLSFLLIFTIFTTAASAAHVRKDLRLSSVSDKNVSNYEAIDLYIGNNKLYDKGLIIGDTKYIPLRSFVSVAMPNAKVTYDSKTKTMTVRGSGLTVSATAGAYVVYANDRALFDLTPATVLSDGKMYLPEKTIAKIFTLRYSNTSGAIKFSGTPTPLIPASKYYREDEVLWLARIIHAESVGESLLGQIGVGSVVLNRVSSKDFPNTIYSVIFDKKYGIQFTPVANGTIYNTPAYNPKLAAKICLEGFRVSDEVLFFLEPKISTSFWISSTRKYAFSIGNHDFYE